MKECITVLILSVFFLAVSCSLLDNSNSLTGIWQVDDNGLKRTISFTSDGYYVIEACSEDRYDIIEMGNYEFDEQCVYTDKCEYGYSFEGKTLRFGNLEYSRITRIARNNSKQLKGVWSEGSNFMGITPDFIVYQGSACFFLKNYTISDNQISVGNSYKFNYLIINSKLYVQDNSGLFGHYSDFVMNRVTSNGLDTASKQILTDYSPWHLVDMYKGEEHWVYYFETNDCYKLDYYSDTNTSTKQYSGMYSLSKNEIELSENSNLKFAIVDAYPFMGTY